MSKGREVREMTEEEIEDFKDSFTLFDNKGDGKVQSTEVGSVIRALGFNPTNAFVKKLLGDRDEYTRVSWEEFLPMLKDARSNKDVGGWDDFIEGMKVFDKEDNGNVNGGEIRHVLCTLAERLEEDMLEPLIAQFEDAAGNVTYEDFVKYIMQDVLAQ